MSKESANFRLELEQILRHFGGKQIISFAEVQSYTGKGWKWCSAHLNIPHNGCTAVQLAQALSTVGETTKRRRV